MIYTVVHASMVGTPFLALVELKLLRRLTTLRPKSRMMPRQMERALEDKYFLFMVGEAHLFIIFMFYS